MPEINEHVYWCQLCNEGSPKADKGNAPPKWCHCSQCGVQINVLDGDASKLYDIIMDALSFYKKHGNNIDTWKG